VHADYADTARPLFTELRAALDEEIERWLSECAGDPLAPVYRWALIPGGKRMRPLLLLATAGAVGGRYETVLPAAVGIELIHCASLVHDDIIDADTRRRGRTAAHHRFGVGQAVLSADSLFFAVFQQLNACTHRGSSDRLVGKAVEIVSTAARQTAQGAAREIALSGWPAARAPQSPSQEGERVSAYVDMVRLKTGALARAACCVGAVLGGGSDEHVRAAAAYGEALGVAYQFQDDMLPYGPGELRHAKPADSDLRNRRPALPLLLVQRLGGRAERAVLAELMNDDGDVSQRQQQVAQLVRRTGALREARRMATRYAERAVEALSPLPAGADRDLLAAVPRQLIDHPWWQEAQPLAESAPSPCVT
jgi:geranylgeranyl pyrophosphate synthase